MIETQVLREKDYSNFIYRIAGSLDLNKDSRLDILEHAADTCFLNDWNLLYLECRGLINDIRASTNKPIA